MIERSECPPGVKNHTGGSSKLGQVSDMPHGTDRPYPIRILAFFEMIRPYHVGIRISGNLRRYGETIVRPV